MTLSIPDRWVWDFWFARDGDEWHIFYLHAPKVRRDPEARHRNARIGHAVSRNLRDWRRLPDPFPAGSAGEWDDLANWTGSVVRADGEWWMFYSAVSTVDGGNIQRIGAAISRDLLTWEKASRNPLSEIEPRWYEELDLDVWHEGTWRDPWVFSDPSGGGFHMFMTARVADGPKATRGVIGHATSGDLLNWRIQPPVTEPGSYGQMEVPQQISIVDRHYLLFSVQDWAQPGVDGALTGTGYLVADSPLGPYRQGPTQFISADRRGSLYAGKLVEFDGELVFLATKCCVYERLGCRCRVRGVGRKDAGRRRSRDCVEDEDAASGVPGRQNSAKVRGHSTSHNGPGDAYVGEISDPMPVLVGDDGGLSVIRAET